MRPNIILIMTDDQHADTLRLMGRTPLSHIYSRLVKQGVTFVNSLTVAPQCSPSRASMLTGQYPHNHGLFSNASATPNGPADFAQFGLLPNWLQGAGYETIMVGKHGANGRRGMGWDQWYSILSQSYYDYDMDEDGAVVHYGNAPDDYSVSQLARRAVSCIRSARQPFFLWLGLPSPHAPHTPQHSDVGVLGDRLVAPRIPGWNNGYVGDKPAHIRNLPPFGSVPGSSEYIDATYRAMTECLWSVDDAVGTVLHELDISGLSTNTWVIYTSDNGYMRGAQRLPYNKVVPYEDSARVPLVIRGPGVIKELVRTELVANIDVTATIAELAFHSATVQLLDGQSLLKLMCDPASEPLREFLLLEFMADVPQNYPVPGGSPYVLRAYRALRSTEWKYVEYNTGERELYDLVRDPFEQRNVHSEHTNKSLVNRLSALLRGVAYCEGAECRI